MRLVYASLAVCTLLATPARAQWDTQSPVPTYLDVRGIAAPTPQRVFVATEDGSFDQLGSLYESPDGGATWVPRNVPESLGSPFNGLFFLDAQRGWAFGNEMYRTTDGGTTWEQLPALGSIYRLEFFSPTFGYAASNGPVSLSRDGGLTWDPAPNGLFAFDFADALVGLGASASGLYRTTDGGATFTLVQAGDADAVAFLSATVAVAIVDGAFARSTDGGLTWTPGPSASGRDRLTVVNPAVVLAWRDGGTSSTDSQLLRSADGGQTWADLGTVFAAGTWDFGVADAQTIAGMDVQGHLYRSADAGATWAQAFASPGPRPSFLSSVRPVFADALTGYVGYGGGFVLRTTDGGATWTQVSSGYGADLADVARLADGTLLAVGDGGSVLVRAAGGGPWRLRQPPTTQALVALDVVGGQTVVAADADGRVYRSTDAGATWTAGASAPPGLDATDVRFTSPTDGWVVGSSFSGSSLYHTTDGGDTWTPVDGVVGGWVAVDVEGSNGWASNVGPLYRRTTDGGATWTPGTLPDAGFLSVGDMDFFDASVGYAVGSFGYAARSADGGVTWEVLPTPTSEAAFTDIHLVGPNELWVSSNVDTLYYSATGGQNWAAIPVGSEGFGTFATVTATAGGEAWVAGYQGYIEHFAGPPPPPLNRPPEAAFTFAANRLTVAFTDTSTDPDGTVVGYFWEFDAVGGGATSTEQHPTYTYPEAGTYIVRLTVTDDDGATGSTGRIVVVSPGPGGTFGGFTEVTPFEPYFVTPQDEDFWVATTAPADYDLDGDLDVAVLGYYVVYNQSVVEHLLLFRNDGPLGPEEWDFTYVEVPLGDLTTGASDLAWGDADGDGDQDLAVGSDGATVLYRNDGGTLVATDTALPGYYEENDQGDFDLRSISWADYDNDGDLDLLLPSVFDFDSLAYRTALMRNDGPNGSGGWTFTEADPGFAPTSHAQTAWADYDGDEDLDLLLVNIAPFSSVEGFIRRYRNDGGGVFVGEEILGALTVEHGEAQWGDYDADGDLDVLVAGNLGELDSTFTATALRIYRNDAETYVPVEVIPCPQCEGWFDITAATWADYDSDGDVDILLTGSYNSGDKIEGRARILVNDGGIFTAAGDDLPAPQAGGTRGGTFSWLDLDGEGDLDYFIAGEYFVPGGNGLIEAQIHAYRNDASGTNAAPTAPTNLNATVVDPAQGGRTVLLTWDAAGDDTTPADVLTYDLDLYLDGVPVETPRRLPEPGDVSAVTSWSLAGLPDGAYTWTVRAVDSAYNGGPVAEGTFALGTVPTEPTGGLPAAYALETNVPNPFRDATTLRYALPERADVTLTVFDALGRQVARLVDDSRPAGYHEVRWDADGLASGTYLVRLSTDAFTATRRVLLLR